MIPVACAVEGITDEPVARRLLAEVGLPVGPFVGKGGGKSRIDPRLPGWNRAAARLPWLVVRDLDNDDRDACIPALRWRLLGDAPSQHGMCFRLAVRSVEAWLLADHEGFRDYFQLSGGLPNDVDEIQDPKTELVNRCRRSRNRDIREGVPPRQESGRQYGPEYVAIVGEFCRAAWSLHRARSHSPSLDPAMKDLDRLSGWLRQPG